MLKEFLSRHDSLSCRLFHTGCLITADESHDKFIQPRGLPNNVLAPLSPLDPSSDAPVIGNGVTKETRPERQTILTDRQTTSKWLISRRVKHLTS